MAELDFYAGTMDCGKSSLATLFPGTARLVELADRVEALQVSALCRCGTRATHNTRTVDGIMVVEVAQVVAGDTDAEAGQFEPR